MTAAPNIKWRYSGPMSLVAQDIHATAVGKGWWGPEGKSERNVGEMLANVHSEVSEAWAEYVHNHAMDETYYTMDSSRLPPITKDNQYTNEAAAKWMRFQDYLKSDGSEFAHTPAEPTSEEIRALVTAGILEPHGVPTELADIVIRVFDMMASVGLDVDDVINEKMLYNLTRAHRHGGKRA